MDDQALLADGSRPADPASLERRLDGLGIRTRTVRHPPVFTVEESKALRGELPGCHTKNLFVRDKKGVMWLVVCREDRKVDLAALAGQLGIGRLSFGSAARLMRHLGVIPGAVTPFAVINDHDGAVGVAIDRGMLAEAPWNFHPLDNAMTMSIEPGDMVRFLEAESHEPRFIDFE
ncbi:MAG: prolyl-tRNA synthetase associated domain-containing protein [Gemmatimonadota bacterium]|jgi:Ala-tRNA(Pro) deacylase